MVCRSSADAFLASCFVVVNMFLIVCSALEQTRLLGRVQRVGFVHTTMVFNYRKYDSVPLSCCVIMFLVSVCRLIVWTILGRFVLCRAGSAGGFGATVHAHLRCQSAEMPRYVA